MSTRHDYQSCVSYIHRGVLIFLMGSPLGRMALSRSDASPEVYITLLNALDTGPPRGLSISWLLVDTPLSRPPLVSISMLFTILAGLKPLFDDWFVSGSSSWESRLLEVTSLVLLDCMTLGPDCVTLWPDCVTLGFVTMPLRFRLISGDCLPSGARPMMMRLGDSAVGDVMM